MTFASGLRARNATANGITTLALLGLMLSSASAEAAPQIVNVSGATGQSIVLHSHVRFGDMCGAAAVPELQILEQPKHGTVSSRVEPIKLTQPTPGFPAECVGKSAPGLTVLYTSTPGYGGQDHILYSVSSQGLPTTTWDVTVEVK